jgi:hypothetical protein
MMNELPYFCFVVIAVPQLWPYYVEVPYTAWPDEAMYYNSNGDCRRPYDLEWSYLEVMNWATYENIVVWNAAMFDAYRAGQMRLRLEDEIRWGEEAEKEPGTLTSAPIARLWLYLLDAIPREYCEPGNVIVSSFRCAKSQLVAAVARLFMRRLQSDVVWDGQTGNLLTLKQLVDLYLEDFPLEASDRLADEAQRVFSEGEAWHREHPDVQIGWWKTLAQVREAIKS